VAAACAARPASGREITPPAGTRGAAAASDRQSTAAAAVARTSAAAEWETIEQMVPKERRMPAKGCLCAAAGTRARDARERGCRTDAGRNGGRDRALIPR
jgi:hypothetical protein